MNKYTINISTGAVIKVVLVVILFLIAYLIRDTIAIILLSVVIASAVDPAARWFSKYKIPRVPAVLIVYFISFLILSAAFYIIIPTLFSEISAFAGEAPSFLESKFSSETLFGFFPQIPSSLSASLQDLFLKMQDAIISKLGGITTGFFNAIISIFGGAMSFVLIIILSFYLSVQEKGIENFIRIITPKEYEKHVIDLWARSWQKIGRWFQGQILLGLLVGILVFLGLTILGVKYALVLAALSAIFELIPIFGPILAAVPAIIIAFTQSPTLGFIVLILFFIIQQFENHLIYPVVVRKTTGVPPILVILALIIGGKLGGFFGILLAMPLAVVLMEIMHDIDLRKRES